MPSVGEWLFEASDLGSDDSGQSNDLTETGTVDAYTGSDVVQGSQGADFQQGAANNCLYRTDANLSAGFPAKNGVVLSGFSLVLLARPQANGTVFTKTICCKSDGITPVFQLSWELSNKFVFRLRSSGGVRIVTGNTGKSLDTWYHVACRWDGSNMSLFIDDTQEGASTACSNIISTNSDPFVIGAENSSGVDYFPGSVDAVRIYDGWLDDDQIGDMYLDPDLDPTPLGGGNVVVCLTN